MKNKRFYSSLAITLMLIWSSLQGIKYCFEVFLKGNLTSNEQVLFSVMLTGISVFISWLISHFYYSISKETSIEEIKKENQESLKIYATKAAEKVRNLSAQLSGLIVYLNEEILNNDDGNLSNSLLAKNERIKSAVQIIKTLKSINDGSLSDWSGVISDELEDIALEQEERMESLKNILNDYDEVSEEDDDDNDNEKDLEELKKKIDLLMESITTLPRPLNSLNKEKVEINCPNCGEMASYSQKPMINSIKKVKCIKCQKRLVSCWSASKGFFIKEFLEPKNKEQIKNDYSPFVVSSDEETIELVKNNLPEQPWPKGICTEIAKKINLPSIKVHQAINALIDRGIFKHQVNGKLYVQEK